MLVENYDTIKGNHYLPYKTLDGTEELPVQVLGQKSAFTQNAYHHNAREADVWIKEIVFLVWNQLIQK